MESERRRHPRSKPSEAMIAILAPTPTLAQVKDLSQGGLRLEYISGPRTNSDWAEVNLFMTKSKTYLSGLPLRLVYDRRAGEGTWPAQFLNRRECGLEFHSLSGQQADQLEIFLQSLGLGVD